MKLSFSIAVILFMILSGFMLIMLSFGMTSNKVSKGKWFKPTLWITSGLLLILLLLTSIFVIEW